MSIINDALKKTQEHIQASQARNRSAHTSVGAWILLALLFLGLLTAFLYFISVFSSGYSHVLGKQSTEHGPSLDVKPQEISRDTVQSASMPRAHQTGGSNLVLNGIMDMGEEHLALINNQIFKTGDTVEGRTILSITTDKVLIDDNGKIIELRTGN